MEFRFSRRGDYVVRAALDLAFRRETNAGEWQKGLEVGVRTTIPRNYVRQILQLLVHRGIVEVQFGRHGGYRLARDPAGVSLLELIEIADGPLTNERCVLRGGQCGPENPCLLYEPVHRAEQALRAELARTDLASLVRAGRAEATARASH